MNLFESILIILSASLLAAVLFDRIKLPTIAAHMVVGAIIGPFGFGFIENSNQFTFIAELGVVFLLFSLGLEFSLPKLLAAKAEVFGLGAFQVGICMLVFIGAVWLWGADLGVAALIAAALALSSTAIVTRELTQNGSTHSYHGRLSIGILLFQDLVAIFFLVLVPLLGGDFSDNSSELYINLLMALFKTVLLFGLLIFVGKWLLPHLYHEIGRTQSEEIFVLATLVICLLSAWVTHSFHLSMALGGFVTGMMLGDSPFKHQIESDIRPFKDILLGIFFVVIGMSIDLNLLSEYWLRIMVFTLVLLLIKGVTISFAVWFRGHKLVESIKVGFILAQAGEFALALITLALLNDVIPPEQASFILIIAMLSMLVSPLFVRKAPEFAGVLSKLFKLDGETRNTIDPSPEHNNQVIIGGFGRVGQMIGLFLEKNKISYQAIESSTELLKLNRGKGKNVIFGDATKVNMLEKAGIADAKLIILTFKSIQIARDTIKNIRIKYPNTPILVRSYDYKDSKELKLIGANQVVPEVFETSLIMVNEALTLLGIGEEQRFLQIKEMRSTIEC